MPKPRATLTNLYPLTEQLAEFGFRLLGAMLEERAGNVLLSPFSVAAALALIEDGTAGETQKEIARVAGLTGVREVARANLGALQEILRSGDRDAPYVLRIATALWLDEDVPVETTYRSIVEDELLAEIHSADFRHGDVPSKINAWVSGKTDGFINSIVDRLGHDERVCVANALYFRGLWLDPFKGHATRQLSFHIPEAAPVIVPFMSGSGTYGYCETRQYQAIQLGYQGGYIAMDIVLPRNGSVSEMAAKSEAFWREVSASLEPCQGNLLLPKFSVDCRSSLEESLRRLGIRLAFTDEADFSPMTRMRPMFIQQVVHRARVDVDEQGTEAAAATYIALARGTAQFSTPKKRFEMVVDHPFIMVIHDLRSRCPLFLGVVTNPAD